ncbi:hypothetical protein PTKIN_Ptkin01aG0367300 [Pterospermum kingtungense]
MDLPGEVVEAILRLVEVELITKEREKTKLMEESLRADLAALEAKERERSMLQREKDRLLAIKEADENLVAAFVEADGNNISLDELIAILALIRHGGNGGGFGGV